MTSLAPQRSYHWIQKAIDSLDAEVDYELIWRLMSCYRSSDFTNNLVYALTFPNFVVTSHGAEAVWRSDGGKVVHHGTQRVEDTETYNMTWWFYGPSDKRCRDAVERINKLHARLARQYPGNFSHNEDYVYTTAFSAILMHRLRERLGLSGFSEKEKMAAHHFWRDMTPLFTVEGGQAVQGFPDDFDGCMRYCQAFEDRPRERNERSRFVCLAIFNQFAFRYFPPGLHWLGFLLPHTLSLPSTLRTMGLEPVHPVLSVIVVFVVRLALWVSEVFLPDPQSALLTELEIMGPVASQKRKEYIRATDRAYQKYVQTDLSGFGCPFGKDLKV